MDFFLEYRRLITIYFIKISRFTSIDHTLILHHKL